MATDPRPSEITRSQIFILSVAEGFFQTSVLFALLKLRIFEHIGEGSESIGELASRLKARPETLARLLNAGVMLKLLESADGTSYRLSPVCRSVLLPSAGENYLGDWIRNMDMFRLALSKLDEVVLNSRPSVDPKAHIGSSPQQTLDFTLAMHNYASLRGRELASHLDATGAATLLDVGCGPGTYAFQLGLANPGLELYLLDLPGVLEVAKNVQQRYPIRNKVHYLPLDVTKQEIQGQYDIVLVSNTLHMLGESASRDLLKRLYHSVNRGGSLVIQAQYLRNDRMGGRWPVFLDLVQLCITSEGRNHTEAETRRWLEEAGLSSIEFVPMSVLNTNSYLRGHKD